MTIIDTFKTATTKPDKKKLPRNMLVRTQLPLFREWLVRHGWRTIPPVDKHEVLRARHPNYQKDIVACTRDNDVTNYVIYNLNAEMGMHYTRYRRDQQRYMDNSRARNESNSN